MLKFVKIRNLIDGRQSNIVIDGVLQIKEMRKQNYNIDDLILQARIKDIASLSEIKYALLETNGQISIYKKSDFEKQEKIYPFPVIISGEIQKESLEILKLSENWVTNEALKQGYKTKDIIYANYENDTLFIMKTKNP